MCGNTFASPVYQQTQAGRVRLSLANWFRHVSRRKNSEALSVSLSLSLLPNVCKRTGDKTYQLIVKAKGITLPHEEVLQKPAAMA